MLIPDTRLKLKLKLELPAILCCQQGWTATGTGTCTNTSGPAPGSKALDAAPQHCYLTGPTFLLTFPQGDTSSCQGGPSEDGPCCINYPMRAGMLPYFQPNQVQRSDFVPGQVVNFTMLPQWAAPYSLPNGSHPVRAARLWGCVPGLVGSVCATCGSSGWGHLGQLACNMLVST